MKTTLRRVVGLAVATLLLGGCVVYATPYRHAGVVIGPAVVVAPPVVVAPSYPRWGGPGRWRGSWHR